MELFYHYTSEQKLNEILESGELIVSEWERKNKVTPPALWLSLNPIWENTATKMISENGKVRRLTKEEQHSMFGLIRFVLEFKKETLCSWAKYKHKSNTPLSVYEQMELTGIRQGANPNEWFASFKNIKIKDCISCQKWNGTEWITLMNF
jgi:hypothetical protein